MNEPVNFIKLMQMFVSVDSVAANALRNQGKGVPQAIQKQLGKINLSGIRNENKKVYEQWLDKKTNDILNAINTTNRPWGTVRKALNLFMRACICNHYLREEYELDKIEKYAELPLDSLVAKALKKSVARGELPQWPGLKHLTAEKHHMFQNVAVNIANQRNIHPSVYLDNFLWLENRGQQ